MSMGNDSILPNYFLSKSITGVGLMMLYGEEKRSYLNRWENIFQNVKFQSLYLQ